MIETLSVKDLRQLKCKVPVPFQIQLETSGNSNTLTVTQILRLLPGKRVVAKGQLDGKWLLLKFFIHSRHFKRHAQREAQGVKAIAGSGCNSAALLFSKPLAGNGIVLAFEFLTDAITLAEKWSKATHNEKVQLISTSLKIIAKLHQAGLRQNDIHLSNFIEFNQRLYCIDGDGIERHHQGQPLASRQRLDNLALYFAQLPPCYDLFISEWLECYQTCAGLLLDKNRLVKRIKYWRFWRIKRYVKKSYRSCSDFLLRKQWRSYTLIRRELDEAPWHDFLQNLDQAVKFGNSLKQGRSATVVQVEFAGKSLVIKRYNMKNLRHRLRRCLLPSRAWKSWGNGYMLSMLSIATPQPIAIVEERFGPLRGKAFLITECIDGESILHRYRDQDIAVSRLHSDLRHFLGLFSTLADYQISHGDMKGSNLLWQNNHLAIIDLDSMKKHQFFFVSALKKDWHRFMQNWQTQPKLWSMFSSALTPCYDKILRSSWHFRFWPFKLMTDKTQEKQDEL